MKDALVFCANGAYAGPLGTTLISLKDNSPAIYERCDKIVYDGGINDTDRETLLKICPELQFIEYGKGDFLSDIILYTAKTSNQYYFLGKIYMLELLKKYEHVIHLDTDIVVVDELAELLDMDYDIAAAINTPTKVSLKKTGAIPEGGKDWPILFGGIVAYSNKINKFDINSEKLTDYFWKTINWLTSIEEQIISYMGYINDMKLLILDRDTWIAPTWASDMQKSKIIHFISMRKAKPWKDPLVYTAYPEWQHCYHKWIRNGGEPFLQFSNVDFTVPNKLYMILEKYAKSIASSD